MDVNTPPECFSKSWESTARECAGGFDAGYVSPSGTHVRPRCDWHDTCKVRTQLSQSNAGGRSNPLIPPSELLKKMYGQQAPSWQPPTQGRSPAAQQVSAAAAAAVAAMTPQQQLQQAQMMMAMMAGQQQPMSPMQNPFLPAPIYPGNFPLHGSIEPIKMQAMSYGMPAYLSVPEARDDGFWPALGRELLRGMGKALGHSIAHFFDTMSFRR